VGVERAGLAAVAGEDDHLDPLHRPRLEQRVGVAPGAGGDVGDDVLERARVRPRRQDRFLRPAQPGGRDELERARDRLRVLDAGDPGADRLQAGHYAPSLSTVKILAKSSSAPLTFLPTSVSTLRLTSLPSGPFSFTSVSNALPTRSASSTSGRLVSR